ncbi:FAD-binding oxidoreductase [Methyloceanibacter caenitepidi]|uniref:Glycolate dehydrogenase, subunit GlcD n=1 Tax=Methyloceanibacter caenitepidi TaxID=1384459 RepID=A0A0A8K1M5_9HYPH|nr:FAD-linked oxidase C-terminal domain-containing protein [Methyloceanibacter caenitepidi]BAQ16397.1 glycolate dehydrogenase, subunit GlcD [Methyloceanibacter caenitepidi]
MSTVTLPDPDRAVMARRNEVVKQLKKLAPKALVIADLEGRRTFESDALSAYRRLPLAVVLPVNTEEVSAVLRFCYENHVKVVPRGAGTSLCGGATPLEDSIVLCLSRMNKVLEIDAANRVARVEAGITNIAITQAAAAQGFFYAPDPSSQVACTVGGNIATNSGGAHCLKYGVTVNNLLGVRMVMIDGEIVDFGGTYLDAPNYDFLPLITGSEGQLGVVTEASVRLIAAPEGARPVLIGFDSANAAASCVAAIIASGIVPVAIEFMDRPAIHVCEHFVPAGYPLDAEAALIVEVEGSEDEIEYLLEKIEDIAQDYNPISTRRSQSDEESALIWKGRKAAFGAIGQISDYMCMDGVIPLSALPEALNGVSLICRKYRFDVANIFHAGDGNLHPLILYDANDPGQLERVELCGAEILKLCVELGGCLTGEHGVGIEKRELMYEQFTDEDIDQQVRIKEELDPAWLLNPGKVFPILGRGVLKQSMDLTRLDAAPDGLPPEDTLVDEVEFDVEYIEGEERL